MAKTDIHYQNILNSFINADEFTKRKISQVVSGQGHTDQDKLERDLSEIDYEDIINIEKELNLTLTEACWEGYEQIGMKKKGTRMVPNCVRISEAKKKKKINPAYLTKDAAAMKKEIDRVKKLKSDDPSAYDKWDADYSDKGKTKKYKTKKSAATSAYEKRFGKKNESNGSIPEPETTMVGKDPETGRVSWDVTYKVKPEELYKRLDDLVKFLDRGKDNPEYLVMRDSVKKLRAKTYRLMNQGKL